MIGMPGTLDTGAGFSKYFEMLPVLSREEREQTFRLRHQVYCEDLGWEARRSDALETDEYDAHSLHCLARSRQSGNFAGCVRLVLGHADDVNRGLPFELTCADTLDRELMDRLADSRPGIAEVSRLAIVRDYRRRRGEEDSPGTLLDSSFGTAEQPRFPYLLVGLYMAVFVIAERHQLDTLFLLVEPRLSRHLNHLGIDNRQVGRAAEHRGLRVPAMIDVAQVIANLNPRLRGIFDVVAGEIAAGYRAAAASAAGSPDACR
ncbi:MAG: putative autoinducer synthesis protein [Candidatus Accumulibacter sp. BA-94]|uniref:PEP-CTERM/exosortase system-associated acyltransferase n=1 Tax=Accumulibacter sp. TaxID=2053492 RepID=UPI00044D7141|nr:PEP-CTERM/exosortase system-associated acyltransferase [Accumulibacter sp.]EXI91982.1 MAG: putative autoinducer synthesis protein [Candidatus Accumulibacter sp. BA-94]HRD88003.1 PEP-CTERM/exosortase system-associated acyltransferase [Accumulibacter sp.]